MMHATLRTTIRSFFALSITVAALIFWTVTPDTAAAAWDDGPPGYCNTQQPDGNGPVTTEWGGGDARYRTRSITLDLGAIENNPLSWRDTRYQQTFWHKKRINSSGREQLDIDCNTVIYALPSTKYVESVSFAAHDRNDTVRLELSILTPGGGTELIYVRGDLDSKDGCGDGSGDCYKEMTIPINREIQGFLFFSYHDDVEKAYLRFQGITTPVVTTPSCTLSASPTAIAPGNSTTLTWTSTNATSATLDGTAITPNGTRSVSPTATKTYKGVFSNGTNTRTCETIVTVLPPLACTSTTVTPVEVKQGEGPVTLTCGAVPGAASYSVTMPANTTAGTPTPVVLTPSSIGAAASRSFPVSALPDAVYNASCVPCRDSAGTDCAAATAPACQRTFTITPDLNNSRCGAVSAVSSNMNFVVDAAGSYALRTITWKQAVETPPKTTTFTIRLFPQTAPSAVITPTVSKADACDGAGNCTYRPDNATMKDLHEKLTAAGTNRLIIEIQPDLADGSSCLSAGVAQVTRDVITTTDTVTVKVRDGACTGNDLPAITGNLSASWPGGSRAPTTATDFTVDIPTGSALTSTYTFTNDLYTCNTSCTTPVSKNECRRERSAGSFETTIYITQQNISGWWETIGGLAYANTLSNPLPLDASNNPLVCGATDHRCAPYVSRSPSFTQSLTAGLPLGGSLSFARGWAAERPTTSQYADTLASTYSQVLKRKGGFAYDHFLSLISEDKRTALTRTTLNALSDLSAAAGKPNYFVMSGSLRIDPSTAISVGSGQRYIIFVPGDLTIANNSNNLSQVLSVANGGFIAFFVKGDIIIEPSVGKAFTGRSNTSMPNAENSGIGSSSSNTSADVAGIYVADGSITIQGNGIAAEPDRRFIGEGSFVSKTAIELKRTYSRDATNLDWTKILAGFTPTEVFRHRPDIVLATPSELKQGIIQYQEIR